MYILANIINEHMQKIEKKNNQIIQSTDQNEIYKLKQDIVEIRKEIEKYLW